MDREQAIEKVQDMRDFIIREHAPNDVWVSHMNEAIKVLSEMPKCKFRSPTNCDFCAFHSDCDEHWIIPELGIGDEVDCDGRRGVLVREPYQFGGDKKITACLIWYGTHMSTTDIREVKPTGRHFEEVGQLLQALGGG